MDAQQTWLLECFKALADNNRMMLISYLNDGERNVTQIAERLELSEPTVSHHLSKLREVGFVTLRSSGNQRFYRVNPSGLTRFKEMVQRFETLKPEAKKVSDNRWIDELPPEFSEDDRAYLRKMTFDGKLIEMPPHRKQDRLQIVLRWLASKFQPDVMYSEREVNTIIQKAHADYATLRRDLIDYGYLRRERGGGKYWLAPVSENETPQ